MGIDLEYVPLLEVFSLFQPARYMFVYFQPASMIGVGRCDARAEGGRGEKTAKRVDIAEFKLATPTV